MTLRLPATSYTSRAWRIHEIVPDFQLEDVWQLPTTGDQGEFPALIELLAGLDPIHSPSIAVRSLFAARTLIGQILGWDLPSRGLGCRVESLRNRLPPDLLERPDGPTPTGLPVSTLYLTSDEWAVETANDTVHGVLHVGWVPLEDLKWTAQLAVLVKPNGLRGHVYLRAIQPFRYLVVYPRLISQIGREWESMSQLRSRQVSCLSAPGPSALG